MMTLKNITVTTILALSLVTLSPQLVAEDQIIKQTQTHNVFKGFLLSIWGKFKTFNPHEKQIARSRSVYTAGIRGAESTGTLIQPYWKDDLTQDKAFQKELKHYGEALTFLDNGNLKQANNSLGLFLQSYPKSALKPNALFAEGISFAGLANNEKAVESLSTFVKEYSSHPLAPDAKSLIAQLN